MNEMNERDQERKRMLKERRRLQKEVSDRKKEASAGMFE